MNLRKLALKPATVLAVAALLGVAALLLFVRGGSAAPIVTTDKGDYHPTETVYVTGSGFSSGKYQVPIIRPNGSIVTGDGTMTLGWDSVTTGAGGSFTYPYKLDGILGTYEVRVYPASWSGNLTQAPVATVTFTDSPLISDFRQCANEDPVLGDCVWTASILQNSNSRYRENMSVPERLVLDNVAAQPANLHTLTFSHQATKGGVHGYDWLTSYDQAIATAAASGLAFNNLPGQACNATIGPPGSLGATCASLRPGPYSILVPVPDDGYVDTTEGSTLPRITAYESVYGNRTIKIYGDAPITAASFTSLTHAGPDTGDSDVNYTLTWTSTSTQILIEMGGHLAVSGNALGWGWGVGQASSNISGGPHHFKLSMLDGDSLGSNDNQIKNTDIELVKGNITITKDAIPDDAQDFSFTCSGSVGSFSLDDDANGTLPNSQTFLNVDPGPYTCTENGPPSLWQLTALVCTDPDGGTTVSLGTRTATIDVDAGETVVCTYTNTKDGLITIIKDALPDDPQNFSFSGTCFTAFSLDDDADGTFSNTLGPTGHSPTSCTVVENAPPSPPWTLTSLTCVDPDGGTTTNLGTGTATLDIDPGENITCTFTNTKDAAITIVKDSVPNDAQDFCFTGGLGSFCLDDDSNPTLSSSNGPLTLPAGSYVVTEGAVSGWNGDGSPGIACTGDTDGGSTPNSPSAYAVTIDLDQGENIVCTFTNTKISGITITKDADPNGPQDFCFTGGLGGFCLDDDSNPTLSRSAVFNPGPGSYTVTESAVAGWDLTVISCTGDTDAGSSITPPSMTIDLDAGEAITCTVQNTQRGTIIVEKQTDPDGAAGSFTFSGSAAGTIGDNGTITVTNLLAGAYSSTEADPAPAFLLASIACDDSDSSGSGLTATFELDPGETVKCTFTNTKQPTLTVNKVVQPAADPGQFDLKIDGATNASCVGNGGSTGAVIVGVGSHTVSESACAGTSLPNYVTSISGDCAPDGSITLAAGDTKACTITNVRRGSIIVEKQTLPNGASASFSFTGDASGTIGDGGTITVANLAPGSYTSTETNPAPDFELLSIACDDGSSGAPSTSSVPALTAHFNLDPGETVKCVFTNRQTGSITITKDAVPDDLLQDFAFTCSPSIGTFTLDDDGGADSAFANTRTFDYLTAGSYTCNEVGPPGGWTLISLVCTDADGGTTVSVGTATATIDLDPGESISCTFTDEKKAKLKIDKVTDPSGDLQAFSFSVSGPTPCSVPPLSDGTPPWTCNNLTPGTYSASETVPGGWDLTSATCDDLSPVGAIVLAPGEVVTCTFVNQKDAFITVCKETAPNADPQMFAFTTSYGPSFNLSDGQCNNSGDLDGGTYGVSETIPVGWDLDSTSCTDGSSPGAISLQGGETVQCSFNNFKQGSITVCKEIVPPDGSTWNFTVTGPDPSGITNLGDGQCQTLTNRSTGSYSVTEASNGPYITDVACNGDNGSGNSTNSHGFTLSAEESVSCTFTNTKDEKQFKVNKDFVPDDGATVTVSLSCTSGTVQTVDPTASENDPADFAVAQALTGATCTATETVPTGYSANQSGCLNVALSSGSCTIVNTSVASIQVCKDVTPNDASAWNFSLAGPTPGSVNGLGDGQCHTFIQRGPGSYTLTETNGNAQYQTTVNCGVNGTGASAITFNLAAGETATCWFTNQAVGSIQVCKDVVPNNGSSWAFAVTNVPSFNLTDNQCQTLGNTPVGSYTITEAADPAYKTSANCGVKGSSQSNSISFTLASGESVVCTFTNEKLGSIQVCKDVVPNDPTTWSFSVSGPTPGNITNIGDGQCQTLLGREPGSYTVAETTSSQYNTTVVCTPNNGAGQDSVMFQLDPAEDAVCTFTNEKLQAPHPFVVHKDFTNNNPDDVVITLTCNAGIVIYTDPTASESDPANFTVHTNLALSSILCTATETVPFGYTVDDSLCVNVQLSTGTCQIINYPQAIAGSPIPVGGQSGLIKPASGGGTGFAQIATLSAVGLALVIGAAWVTAKRRADR